jgi:hypothetical protein
MHKKYTIMMLTIFLLAGAADADMVILKSGEMFQTRRAWKENGVVSYYRNGQVVRVDQAEVERLIHSPAPVEGKPIPEHRPAADPNPLTEGPPAGQTLTVPLPEGGTTGYLDLRWGQPPSQVEGLEHVATDPAYGGVQQYTTRTQPQRFGRARVDTIFLGFWQEGLYTILVEVSNYPDFLDLKAEAFRRFGDIQPTPGHLEHYRWADRDRGSDRLLSYDLDADSGYLWMRSRALHDKVKARYPD